MNLGCSSFLGKFKVGVGLEVGSIFMAIESEQEMGSNCDCDSPVINDWLKNETFHWIF